MSAILRTPEVESIVFRANANGERGASRRIDYVCVCCYYLTLVKGCIIGSFMTTPAKRKALLASGTLNPHPEAVRSELFQMDFFDPYDLAQVKYEMLRAHSVDDDPVAEVCRRFGLSRESFYQIQRAFLELGFGSFLPRKRGRKGPVKLKGEVLEFAFAKQKENPDLDPGRLAALIQERFSIPIHRTTVLRGMKKKRRSPRKGSANNIRGEQRPSAGDL
jgi:transposase